jgi:hypothetical protein
MLWLINRILPAVAATLLVAAAPAVADPDTTGGLPAGEPPVISPQGGVNVSGAGRPATAAQTGDDTPGTDGPTDTTPTETAPETPAEEDDSTVDVPVADPAPETEPAATTSAPSGGGGLPHTGFAVAALVAIGTGFVLTGYALRYSRALDG